MFKFECFSAPFTNSSLDPFEPPEEVAAYDIIEAPSARKAKWKFIKKHFRGSFIGIPKISVKKYKSSLTIWQRDNDDLNLSLTDEECNNIGSLRLEKRQDLEVLKKILVENGASLSIHNDSMIDVHRIEEPHAEVNDLKARILELEAQVKFEQEKFDELKAASQEAISHLLDISNELREAFHELRTDKEKLEGEVLRIEQLEAALEVSTQEKLGQIEESNSKIKALQDALDSMNDLFEETLTPYETIKSELEYEKRTRQNLEKDLLKLDGAFWAQRKHIEALEAELSEKRTVFESISGIFNKLKGL